MVLTRAGLQQVCWGVLAGAAGGKAECVEHELPAPQRHQLVLRVLLPAPCLQPRHAPAPPRPRPRPRARGHPHHLLVLGQVVFADRGVDVDEEPGLALHVARHAGEDEGGVGVAQVVPLPLHQPLAALQLDRGHTGSRGFHWLHDARHSFVLPLQRRFDLALWIVVRVGAEGRVVPACCRVTLHAVINLIPQFF